MGCLKKNFFCKTSIVPMFSWIGGVYLYQLPMFRGVGQSRITFSYSDEECFGKSSFVRNWRGPCPELTSFLGGWKTTFAVKTSSQKLGRCASRRVRLVWKTLGQVRFGNPKGTFVVKSKLGSLYSVFTPFFPFELYICSSYFYFFVWISYYCELDEARIILCASPVYHPHGPEWHC